MQKDIEYIASLMEHEGKDLKEYLKNCNKTSKDLLAEKLIEFADEPVEEISLASLGIKDSDNEDESEFDGGDDKCVETEDITEYDDSLPEAEINNMLILFLNGNQEKLINGSTADLIARNAGMIKMVKEEKNRRARRRLLQLAEKDIASLTDEELDLLESDLEENNDERLQLSIDSKIQDNHKAMLLWKGITQDQWDDLSKDEKDSILADYYSEKRGIEIPLSKLNRLNVLFVSYLKHNLDKYEWERYDYLWSKWLRSGGKLPDDELEELYELIDAGKKIEPGDEWHLKAPEYNVPFAGGEEKFFNGKIPAFIGNSWEHSTDLKEWSLAARRAKKNAAKGRHDDAPWPERGKGEWTWADCANVLKHGSEQERKELYDELLADAGKHGGGERAVIKRFFGKQLSAADKNGGGTAGGNAQDDAGNSRAAEAMAVKRLTLKFIRIAKIAGSQARDNRILEFTKKLENIKGMDKTEFDVLVSALKQAGAIKLNETTNKKSLADLLMQVIFGFIARNEKAARIFANNWKAETTYKGDDASDDPEIVNRRAEYSKRMAQGMRVM